MMRTPTVSQSGTWHQEVRSKGGVRYMPVVAFLAPIGGSVRFEAAGTLTSESISAEGRPLTPTQDNVTYQQGGM